MKAFFQFRADRAFSEGMQAYRKGQPNHAPAMFGENSGDWVRGWNVAWLAERIKPAESVAEKPRPPQSLTA
jgi:hypothetical protein